MSDRRLHQRIIRHTNWRDDQLGLHDFRYLHSTKAELLRRLGRDEAQDAYRRAKERADDGTERRFLEESNGFRASRSEISGT